MNMRNKYHFSKLLPITFSAVSLLTGNSVFAQQSSLDSDELSILEEVVVTSRKMGAESLQEIPAAISALDSEALKEMMVVNFEDFARTVPGLTFDDRGPGQRRYVVRGVRSAGQQQVAVYYDEVPIPGAPGGGADSGGQTTDLKLHDMERVEVLRGPQGTVFGANSQGGTIRFISKQPVLGELSGSVSAELSRTDPSADNNGNYQLLGNIPLSENLAARVVIYGGEDAGYIDNTRCRSVDPAENPTVPGTEVSCFNKQDFNWYKHDGMRTNLLWEVSEKTRIRGQFWWQDRTGGGTNAYYPFDSYNRNATDKQLAGNVDTPPSFTYFNTGEFQSGNYANEPSSDEQFIYSLTGESELPFADLTATVSHYDRELEVVGDTSYTLFGAVARGGSQVGTLPTCDTAADYDPRDPTCFRSDLLYGVTHTPQSVDQDAVEIRFNSNDSESAIQWVGGVFWRERETSFTNHVTAIDVNGNIVNSPIAPVLSPTGEIGDGISGCAPCIFSRQADKVIEERAIFGEVDWAVTEALNINFGIRWFDVEQVETGFTRFNLPIGREPNPPSTDPSIDKLSDSETPWKLAVAWHLGDETTVYALRANGFRLSGTNSRGLGEGEIPETFESDELVNYEVGLKTILGERTTFNVSAFLMEWDNMQVSGRSPDSLFRYVGNAGTAEIEGVELELNTSIGDRFRVNGQITYLSKKELTEDQVSADIVAPGVAGDEIPRVPEMTASIAAYYDFTLPVPDWEGTFSVSGSYSDSSYTEFGLDDPLTRFQDAYSILDTRLNFRNEKNGFDVTLFIDNLTDERGDVSINSGRGRPTAKLTNRPKTFGIQISKRFGE